MASLRTAVLMKTDIAGSTPRFRTLLAEDQQALLRDHRALVAAHAAEQGGEIIRGAGDGFWLEFPSATSAARAGMAIQEALRLEQPIRGNDRLAMRIVIGLGDVGELDGELIGELLALIVRVETITPADEIYLTPSARLALVSAEVQTSRVDAFALKGFTEPVEVYRVEHRHRSCILPDTCILLTDLRGFTRVTEAASIATIERILTTLDSLAASATHQFGGTIRYSIGDGYCITFDTAKQSVAAAERLSIEWDAVSRRDRFGCPINLVLHRGYICGFRSFLYGKGLTETARVQRASLQGLTDDEGGVLLTEAIRRDLADSQWQDRIVPVTLNLPDLDVYRLSLAEAVIPPPAARPPAP
jgi:class 3 adenylate cyclase